MRRDECSGATLSSAADAATWSPSDAAITPRAIIFQLFSLSFFAMFTRLRPAGMFIFFAARYTGEPPAKPRSLRTIRLLYAFIICHAYRCFDIYMSQPPQQHAVPSPRRPPTGTPPLLPSCGVIAPTAPRRSSCAAIPQPIQKMTDMAARRHSPPAAIF